MDIKVYVDLQHLRAVYELAIKTGNLDPMSAAVVGAAIVRGDSRGRWRVVVVGHVGTSKIPAIKAMRARTSMGLKETKNAVECGDYVLREGLSRGDADALARELAADHIRAEVKR